MNASVTLVIQGIGEVPSFKNSKMIARGRLITDPKKQQWMERCTKAIEYQLRCWLLTIGTETAMECIPQSKIASLLPLDDSLKWIGLHSVSWRKVKKGDEGFEIVIQQLP